MEKLIVDSGKYNFDEEDVYRQYVSCLGPLIQSLTMLMCYKDEAILG